MKVLFCSPNNHVGGISRWTQNILEYYEANKPSNTYLELFYPGKSKKESTASSGIVERVRNAAHAYLPLLRKLGKKIDETHPSIVHFSTSASLGLFRDYLTNRICRRKGVPTALHYHFGRIPQLITSKNWEGRLFRKVARSVTVNIVLDKPSYDAMVYAGYTNVEILPNPLSTTVQRLVEKFKSLPPEPRSIVFVGHMVESKGIFELVEACRDIPEVKVHMIGAVSDETKNQLFTLGGDNSKKWLNIAGVKSFEEVIKAVKRSELFVLPTYSEGFPNVIIESMACGKPSVSTPVGAIADMLDIAGKKPCGICVPVKDVTALRAAIRDLLDNPDISSEMGHNAMMKVNAYYNMDKVFDRLVKIWNKYSR